MVLSVDLGTQINVETFFNLLTIPYIPRRTKVAKGRVPIPYFHQEGIIVSVRHAGNSRGYRPACNIKSFGDADLQMDGRNYHFKVSPERLNILGVTDIEKSRRAFTVMIEHIKQVERNWAPCRSLSSDVIRKTISWVWDHITITSDLPTIVPQGVDPRFALLLTSLTNTVGSRVEYDDKILSIIQCIPRPLFERPPSIMSIWICNSVYNFKVPSRLSLYVQVKKLRELGYRVGHHNIINGKSLRVSVPVASSSPSDDSAEDAKFHKFTIRNAGTINQTSPTPQDEAYHVYRRLVYDLGFVPYHDTSLLGEKTSEQIEEEITIKKKIDQVDDAAPRQVTTEQYAYLMYAFSL